MNDKNTINNSEVQKRIIEMYQNRSGDLEYWFNPDDGIPEWLKPYGDVFKFKQSTFVEKGKGYFVDTGKITFKAKYKNYIKKSK